ncbi:MAG: AAA family ATPase [Chloroflexi bacterium]|nr:AAA family ATPase [Chloroflexota bacterium]
MKILELDIQNIRGLPNVSVPLGGRNLLVWGPNGSGKSGVVDAVDFLLSGRITRLTGPGTGGISLAQHGSHVDAEPEEAVVRARIDLPGIEGPIDISRSIGSPDHLDCPEEARALLSEVEALARRGQHILTRRDILRYITADPSSRADQIQKLLDLSDVENLRRGLVTVVNSLRTGLRAAQGDVGTQEERLAAALDLDAYREAEALRLVNEHRVALGAPLITELKSQDIKAGVSSPSPDESPQSFNPDLAKKDVSRIEEALSESRAAQVKQVHKDFLDSLSVIRSDPDLLHELKRLQLIEKGLDLLDGSGRCPLCDTQLDAEALKNHLEGKRDKGRQAKVYEEKLGKKAEDLRDFATNVLASIDQVATLADGLGDQRARDLLEEWHVKLSSLQDAMDDPIGVYSNDDFPLELAGRLWAPESIEDRLVDVGQAIERAPPASARQTSWDVLTRALERLSDLEGGHDGVATVTRASQRAQVLIDCFQRSRDAVLENLYSAIRDRFVEFYKILHDHEPDFSASLQPEGAGLDFRVDFMGRGAYSPQALHSEGHQDSMGLCLFLALAERLSAGLLGLIVLDDVVMSVDSEHRRQVCRLLTESFPDKQFVITTHDQTWAMQLKAAGVVQLGDMIHFVNWTLQTGPIVGQIRDLWERIKEALDDTDVNDAAARLRRGCEQYFEMVCDSLHARVRYNSEHRWDLEDWLRASLSRYSELLKNAKSTAQSWGETETVESLNELSSVKAQIFERCQIERWAVNPSVHYNNWANLTPDEFTPVVQAFHDLCTLFECSACGQLIQVTEAHGVEVAVKCPCGQVTWNLERSTTTS